ncbi:MAG: SGNH/GDSL hydrolase family protein [Deltaproteobacteria bacterium]|nr:SGNH/GDSL hydrolase family protein [Deltaproteobacteria bacterium]
MKFRDGRNFYITETKPQGAFRILCLGDSMLYGQGVNDHETLPAKLEMFLNRAAWSLPIEVINEGHCGYSIHDEWNQFIQRGYRYQPDLIIWFLCDNDAELFGVQENYAQHVEVCWDEKGVHLPYFRLVFKDIADHIKSLGIPLVFSFYYIYDNPLREKCARIIKSLCDAHGVEFIDLSEAFSGSSSAHINRSMQASDIDQHPSWQAHQIAAQRLARYLINEGAIGKRNNFLLSEKELYGNLIKNAEEMLDVGYPAEYTLHRLVKLSEWKRSCKIRLKLSENLLLPDAVYFEMFTSLKEIFNSAVELLYWQSYAYVLKISENKFLKECLNIDSMIQTIKKIIFIAEKNLEHAELGYRICINRSLPDGWDCNDLISELPMELNRWLTCLNKIHAFEFDKKSSSESSLNSLCKYVNYEFRSVKNYINNYWDECDRIIKAYQHILADYLCLRTEIRGKSSGSAEIDAIHALDTEIVHLSQSVKSIINLVNLELISEVRLPSVQQPITHVRLRLIGKTSKVFNMTVCLNSLVPDYPVIKDIRIAYNDGQLHAYTFDFPLFIYGSVSIRFDRPGETVLSNDEYSFEDIQIGYDQDTELTIGKDDLKIDDNGNIVTPLIWFPHGLVKGNGENDDLSCMSDLYKESRYIKYEMPKDEIISENGCCSIFYFKTRAGLIFTYTGLYSSLIIYEDDKPLKYPGSIHDDIRELGGGRYCNSYGRIFFSSSDNSDPKKNRRVYSIQLPSYIYFLERLPEATIKQLGL